MLVNKIVSQSVKYQSMDNSETVGIILAQSGSNSYITWQYTYFNTAIDPVDNLYSDIDTSEQNFYHGHYISNFKDASADYFNRVKRLKEGC